uniref:protein phosphatase 1 regulatory subunit 14D n=1 Tax=Panthera onca TaxID=9690 RepID=UPI002953FF95|nr:protein phosphatase 1 regulatory subunit 14D [Panthera onca]
MLSSSPTSCTSPNADGENPSKKVQWTSGRRRTSSTDSESKSHPDISKVPRSRRPSRLTVKYDRGQLQRWLEMELWVDAQIQELFQVSATSRVGGHQGPGREPAGRPQEEPEGQCERKLLATSECGFAVQKPACLWSGLYL